MLCFLVCPFDNVLSVYFDSWFCYTQPSLSPYPYLHSFPCTFPHPPAHPLSGAVLCVRRESRCIIVYWIFYTRLMKWLNQGSMFITVFIIRSYVPGRKGVNGYCCLESWIFCSCQLHGYYICVLVSISWSYFLFSLWTVYRCHAEEKNTSVGEGYKGLNGNGQKIQ